MTKYLFRVSWNAVAILPPDSFNLNKSAELPY
jgi:hypothetical protein